MIHRHSKGIVRTILVMLALAVFSGSVFAVTQTEIDKAFALYQKTKSDKKAGVLQDYIDLIVDYRLEAIESVIGKVGTETRISEKNLGEIFALLDSYKDSLNFLKISAVATENLEELQDIVEDVFWSNRIFSVVIPKTYGLKTVGKAEYVLENDIKVYIDSIEESENLLTDAGKKTDTLKEKISDLNVIIEDIEYQLAEAKTNLVKMEPSRNVTIASSQLSTARKHLTTFKEKMSTAQFRMYEIAKILDDLSK